MVTKDSRKTRQPADNMLDGVFISEHPNRKWVSNVIYIPTRKGWLKLPLAIENAMIVLSKRYRFWWKILLAPFL